MELDLLWQLFVFCVVGGLLYYLVLQLPLPPPFKVIAQVLAILIAIVVLLNLVGWWPGPHWRR